MGDRTLRVMEAHLASECPDRESCWARDIHDQYSPRFQEWMHSRKGLIKGVLVREADTWMWVRLSGDHELRWFRDQVQDTSDGSVICVRKSLCRSVSGTPEEQTP